MFGFIALLPQLSWAWIPYIIFTSTQGLIIFMAFLYSKRVALLYRSLLFCKKEPSSTKGSGIKRHLEQ
ncbi:MAG: Mth family G-protein coupled receptor [Proteobacteria bacterium]|nr:Mth family G-protein coupled receptor [Pseudomonadota bacterium]